MEFYLMSIKKIKTLQSLKDTLKKTLPQQISKVIKSYEAFSEHEIPEDAKGFSAHHSACKSAVVHAETLLKLARWTEGDVTFKAEDNNDDELAMLLNEAEQEQDKYKDE